MHYIVNNHLIESELAAKSYKQPNKHILQYIAQLPKYKKVLDYGCGRLRYEIPLSEHADEIFAIDSKKQMSRIVSLAQTGEILKKSNCKINLLAIDDVEWRRYKYDIVFCTNVLSAIPIENERLKLLKNARDVLKENGYMFISVQYRNSYFKEYGYRDDTFPYKDGWMIKRSSRKCYFYALLNAEYIVSLCKKAGFKKFVVTKKDGSCFVEARI